MPILIKIINFLFPINCCECGKMDILSRMAGICKKCIPVFVENENTLCTKCSSILNGSECEYCNSRNVFFDKLYFVRSKGSFERKIINKIKFKNDIILSNFFRIGLWRIFNDINKENISYLTSVPSHKKTMRVRPIHQMHSLISKFQKKRPFHLKSQALLEKISSSLQSGKTYRERFIHAKNSFQIKAKYSGMLHGNAILIDDIFTTGASINECSKILKENGIHKIIVIVFVKNTAESFFA